MADTHTGTYYELLDIPITASTTDIKKAYRKLAIQYHPDKTGNDPLLTERFKEITIAYQILSHQDSRQQYDIHLTTNMRTTNESHISSEFYRNANVFMQHLFDFIRENHSIYVHNDRDRINSQNDKYPEIHINSDDEYGMSGVNIINDHLDDFLDTFNIDSRKNKNTTLALHADPADIYNGKSVQIRYKVTRQAAHAWVNDERCLMCDGEGYINNRRTERTETCNVCGGTGCGLAKLREEILTLDVPLYEKVVRFKNLGNQEQTGDPGDIIVCIHPKLEIWPGLTIDGYNIRYVMDTTLTDVLRGYKTISLFGHHWRVWFKDLGETNQWIFHHKGMPIRRKKSTKTPTFVRGDLTVVFKLPVFNVAKLLTSAEVAFVKSIDNKIIGQKHPILTPAGSTHTSPIIQDSNMQNSNMQDSSMQNSIQDSSMQDSMQDSSMQDSMVRDNETPNPVTET